MKKLFEAIATAYDAQPLPIAGELSDALRSSDRHQRKTPHEPAQTGRALDRMLGDQIPEPHPILAEIAQIRETLVWYKAASERIPDAIGSRLSFVELLGPDGMVYCGHCRLGLLLQMPDLCYPGHVHAANELYLVLSGNAEWQTNALDTAPRPPGSFIYHPGGHWHAMNTRSEPLLAVWGWTGDIGFGSYSMDAKP